MGEGPGWEAESQMGGRGWDRGEECPFDPRCLFLRRDGWPKLDKGSVAEPGPRPGALCPGFDLFLGSGVSQGRVAARAG